MAMRIPRSILVAMLLAYDTDRFFTKAQNEDDKDDGVFKKQKMIVTSLIK